MFENVTNNFLDCISECAKTW